MQNEVIDDILNVEQKATQIVLEAEQKAQEIILEAQTNARKELQAKVEEVRAQGNKDIDIASKTLDDHVSQYEKERERLEVEGAKLDKNILDVMVERVVKRISEVN